LLNTCDIMYQVSKARRSQPRNTEKMI
jgi:hypothetical protein